MKTNAYKQMLAAAFALASCLVVYGQNTGTANLGGTNYISVDVFTSSGGASSFRDVTYYDGLGYPVQSLSVGANTRGNTIVTPVVYDVMRRSDARTCLPYAENSGTALYIPDAVSNQRAFYQSLHDDSYGYSEKEYESSPAGRVISAMNAGKEYRSSDRKGVYSYAANSDADAVVRFTYDYPTGDITTASITSRGTYPANTLEKVSSTDEDGGRTETFTDGRGRLICTRQYPDGSTRLETHYVYDLKDSLVCVIQPKGMEELGTLSEDSSVSFGSDLAQRSFFLYRYDGQGRVIESQVPDGGVSEYVYDIRGRLVASATAEMSSHDLYKVTEYDVLDRVTREYYASFSTPAETMRAQMSVEGGSLPSHIVIRRTRTAEYYPFDGSGGGSALDFAADELATASDVDYGHCRGLLKRERVSSVPQTDGTVLVSDTLSVERTYYYDYRGRVIQMRELSSDGWASSVSTKYDFVGNVTGTLESHTSPAGKTNTVKTLRTLDRRGVVLREEIYADGGLLTSTGYIYDELMRPVGKSTGSVSETFAYDIRGWQTGHAADRDSDRIYSETLRYMTLPEGSGSVARWTGLISESETQQYGPIPARSDSYGYDAIGRMISSNNENNISYDANGNVMSLRRISATGTTIADLSMSYSGNRLASVTNTGTEDTGTFTYAYDSSGNLTSDGRNRLQIQNKALTPVSSPVWSSPS